MRMRPLHRGVAGIPLFAWVEQMQYLHRELYFKGDYQGFRMMTRKFLGESLLGRYILMGRCGQTMGSSHSQGDWGTVDLVLQMDTQGYRDGTCLESHSDKRRS